MPLLPSSGPIIKLEIGFQSVWLKAVIFVTGYTTERQNFLQIVDTAKENELNLQFHVYRKIQCSVSSFESRYPTALGGHSITKHTGGGAGSKF